MLKGKELLKALQKPKPKENDELNKLIDEALEGAPDIKGFKMDLKFTYPCGDEYPCDYARNVKITVGSVCDFCDENPEYDRRSGRGPAITYKLKPKNPPKSL